MEHATETGWLHGGQGFSFLYDEVISMNNMGLRFCRVFLDYYEIQSRLPC